MRRAGLVACVFALLVLGPVNAAFACAFHYTKPERTAVDWLVDGDQVVLARPDSENPFVYVVTQALRGAPDVMLPFLVDSTTRRKLAANPQDAILFARNDGADWTRVAYVDQTFRPLIQAAMQNADVWALGFSADRLALFAGLQTHPDRGLRRLALQEIDKAPYAHLRSVTVAIPAKDLATQMWTRDGYPYQSIRVLLLGLEGSAIARDEVHGFIDRVADWDWANNLGAFATALVELDGPQGVEKLERVFLTDVTQPADKIEQVVEALAIHNGLNDGPTTARIALALQAMVDARPDAAQMIARQFMARSDWTQAQLLETVMAQRKQTVTAGLLAVAVYVAQARAAGALTTKG